MRRWMIASTVTAMWALWPASPDLAVRPVRAQDQTMNVEILAERFRFTPDEIRVRRGSVVLFRLSSDDTDHGFRIVGTDVDRVIPKRGRGTMVVPFTPPQAGRYTFECSKVCGAGHDFMHGVLIVED